ncbi:MAG TPA: hypothetical protein VLA14_00610 [Polyangia bacterium]|nr:hypothetical protein [Polyangia bacterium]
MQRKTRLFSAFVVAAMALFAAAVGLTFAQTTTLDWSLSLIRFLILAAGIGCAIAAWGAAVAIAYVHRITWPFWLMTGLVVTAGLAFAVVCVRLS